MVKKYKKKSQLLCYYLVTLLSRTRIFTLFSSSPCCDGTQRINRILKAAKVPVVLDVVAVLVNLGCAPGKPVLLSGARGEGGALAGEHGDNHQQCPTWNVNGKMQEAPLYVFVSGAVWMGPPKNEDSEDWSNFCILKSYPPWESESEKC